MPIVKWPIPIIGKLADYPIIGAPLSCITDHIKHRILYTVSVVAEAAFTKLPL